MSLKFIEKGKLYKNKNYNFEVKEYFTTLSIARNYIECCKDDDIRNQLLDWLVKYNDDSVMEYDFHDPTYNTIGLWIKNGELKYYTGGLGFVSTRRVTRFLNTICYDKGEVIIMKIIHPKFSDYIEEIDIELFLEGVEEDVDSDE